MWILDSRKFLDLSWLQQHLVNQGVRTRIPWNPWVWLRKFRLSDWFYLAWTGLTVHIDGEFWPIFDHFPPPNCRCHLWMVPFGVCWIKVLPPKVCPRKGVQGRIRVTTIGNFANTDTFVRQQAYHQPNPWNKQTTQGWFGLQIVLINLIDLVIFFILQLVCK